MHTTFILLHGSKYQFYNSSTLKVAAKISHLKNGIRMTSMHLEYAKNVHPPTLPEDSLYNCHEPIATIIHRSPLLHRKEVRQLVD
jgi:hypothetical protein